MCPDKVNKAGDKAERNVLCGAAEDSGFVWFGEKEAEGQHHCNLQFLR